MQTLALVGLSSQKWLESRTKWRSPYSIRGRSAYGVIANIALIFLCGCAEIPKIPVKSDVFGQRIETTVDSAAARYFIERYLPGRKENSALDVQFDDLYQRHGKSMPTRETLHAVSRDFSVDVAAIFLADHLLRDECNRALHHSFTRELSSEAPLASDVAPYVLLFAPGWDYVATGHLTGANFAAPRKLATAFGLDHVLVALPPIASVEDNARVLQQEIQRQIQRGKRILLAGASSSGPAIQLALSELLTAHEITSVKAWINLGGILQGSPLIDQFQSWPKRWLFNLGLAYMGWDRDAVMSMSVAHRRPRFQRLNKIPGLLIINYVGIPLSGQISRNASDKYPLLREKGPNDGLTLLTDIIAPGSVTLVALGSDHFFAEDPEINRKTAAMIRVVFAYLGKDPTMHVLNRCVFS